MNDEFPTDPRKALEASLTALLLGELPEDQARFLRQAMATDPELAKTFETLKTTIELVRETEARPVPESIAPPAALKLSEQRRQELLQHFKTVRPAVFREPTNRKSSWQVLLPVAAAVTLMMVLAALLLPALARSKSRSLARRTMNEPESHEVVLSALPQEIRERKLEDKLAENERLGHSLTLLKGGMSTDQRDLVNQPPRKGQESISRIWSAATLQTSTAGPGQNKIVLPTEPKPESIALGWSAAGDEKQSFGFDSELASAPISSSGRNVSISTFNREAGIGSAGEGLQRPLMLGDSPAVGGMFRPDSIPTNTPSLEWDFARKELRGHYEDIANSKDRASSQVPNLESTQQLGTFFGGAAFGGFSFAERPGPGSQQVAFTQPPAVAAATPSLAEVAQVTEKSQFESRTGLSWLSAKVEAAKVEAAKKPDAKPDQKVALAELDDVKQRAWTAHAGQGLAGTQANVESLKKETAVRSKALAPDLQQEVRAEQEDVAAAKPAAPPPEPQPEIQTQANPFSTFSLNVSDVSCKLAQASLEKGVLPDAASIRSEEFINAFDYHDPEPSAGAPVGFAWERAAYPFVQNRDLLRFSIKTAATGRQTGQRMNLVLLLDNSGSMERADRVRILHEALRVLATQLRAQDTFSVVTFARTARLWVDGVPGDQAGRVVDELSGLTPQGGTNLEEAMNLAYQTALRHYTPGGINRVVLLTDGAANLGDTDPQVLKTKVETNRKQGIALDCFGVGWEGYNDDLLETLTRNGDGRYGFLNTPEQAASEFAGQLAGALHVAASDVKVQVEFNTNRVKSYRQIGYARHQLTKEQFRDNTVDAAEIGAAESGNALYVIETNAQGEGPLAIVRVRYKIPGTDEYHEHEWTVPFTGSAPPIEQASPAMRLATAAGAFSEWLALSPFAGEVTTDRLLACLSGVPSVYGNDPRPQKLEWMIRQAKALSGK